PASAASGAGTSMRGTAAGSATTRKRPFRALSVPQACGVRCRQETIRPILARGTPAQERAGEVLMDGFNALDAIADAKPGLIQVGVGAGSAVVLTAVGRLAIPVGNAVYRHLPLLAGAVGAAFSAAVRQGWPGALAAVIVGAGIWTVERVTEYQAFRLLPRAGG
ncbi:MAG: hypothetical protein ABIF82_03595, partial [Planctomycetota bacterium]